jgi:thiosulfate/3-mercaptopyruvate sulfurtransferase
MFKVLGHNPNQLYILDGGFQAWQQYGGKVETGEPRTPLSKSYVVNFEAHFIRTLLQMKTNLHHPAEQVVDVRHPSYYMGAPERRPGMRSGHIPGSVSFPYFTMFEKNGRWKPIDKIRKQFISTGVDLAYPIVTLSDSGMSAAVLNFALDLMGDEVHALYDGSWSEWGTEVLFPGEDNLKERPVITSLESGCDQ